MSEVFGYIMLTLLFVIFGGFFVIMMFQSVFFSFLNGFVDLLTKLGVASIIPAGIYALLKWQKEKNGEQRLDGNSGSTSPGSTDPRVGVSDNSTRGRWLGVIGQSLLSRSKEGSRSGRNGQSN